MTPAVPDDPAAAHAPVGPGDSHDGGDTQRVRCHLDQELAARGMTLAELALRAGVTVVNLSVLKNNRARAIRFTTLTAVCDVLGCQPGDLFSVHPTPGPPEANPTVNPPRHQ